MNDSSERTVSRETKAIQIPDGTPILIPAGATVRVTQTLGGSFTVLGGFGLARISGCDADSIGEKAIETPQFTQNDGDAASPDKEALWAQLKTVYDPEIPVNIVDLGLVYSLSVSPLEKGGHQVEMCMTLTAPGCGMGPAIAADAKSRLLLVPGVSEAEVKLVWEPAWNQTMISEEGKMKLGLI